MKKAIKELIYSMLANFNFKGVVILMYHSISDNEEFFTVKPHEFKRQMQYLKDNNFRVIGLAELLEELPQEHRADRTVVITFDDGFEDNYLNALPVLEKFGFNATIFLSSDMLGGVVTGRKGAEMKILAVEEIRVMQQSGLIDFGCHGRSHKKLTQMDEALLEEELAISKKRLEDILEKNIADLAFPFGDYNDNVKKEARRHFRSACTVKRGRVDRSTDLFELNRNSIDSHVSFRQFKGIVKYGRI